MYRAFIMRSPPPPPPYLSLVIKFQELRSERVTSDHELICLPFLPPCLFLLIIINIQKNYFLYWIVVSLSQFQDVLKLMMPD